MPATETQVGKAKLFGLDGASIVTLVGTAYITIESGDFEDNWDHEEHKGQNGEVESLIASNQRYSVTCQFAPAGNTGGTNTRAQAIDSAAKMLATPISKVVTSGFSIAAFNGNWNVLPGTTMRMVRDGIAVMTLKLIAHLANRGTSSGQLQSAAITG